MLSNLFTPGFANNPTIFAGRQKQLNFIAHLIAGYPYTGTPTPVILSSPRGMGKTVLLYEIAKMLTEQKWKVYFTEAGKDNFLDFVEPQSWQMKEVTVEISISPKITPTFDKTSTTNLLQKIDEELYDGPVALLIDELHQVKPSEFKIIGAWLQSAMRANRPLLFIGSGLPGLSAPKAVSYLERAHWDHLERLSDFEAMALLDETFALGGKKIDLPLLNNIVLAAYGYPYALQMYGFCIWTASQSTQISEEEMLLGMREANTRMKTGVFLHRWSDTSAAEREYLQALASLRQENPRITNARVTELLAKTPKQKSYLVDRLVKKGIITRNVEDSSLDFLFPAMIDWILEAE